MVKRPQVSNGRNPQIVEGKWQSHRGVIILVHPGNYEYIICNRWADRISNAISIVGLEKGEESSFFNSLENTYPYEEYDSCDPAILLDRHAN